MDNLAQQDQGGTNCQYVKTWLGPTLGWAMLPVMPEVIITSPSPLVISAYASRVLLNSPVKAISLPAASQWLQATLPLGNIAAFDRSLWIKDFIGQASSASPIVITPAGADLIDGQPNFSIINAFDLIRLYPLTNLFGWYVG